MTQYYKYPRTLHLEWSKGLTTDDKRIESLDAFIGKRVIVTEKVDGENTSLYPDHLHARSMDSKHHQICFNIPEHNRFVGENVYAKHSIFYDKLPSYFLLFSMWTDEMCWSWDDTVEWAKLLGLETVPVLYDGIWDEDKVKACWTGVSKFGPEQEGYVVRLANEFSFDDFSKSVVKFVRENHVQTSEHWLNEKIVPNLLEIK